ncbi:MAG: HAMP domain-containing protein [Thermoleophilaceae bacterium]|nr:HAMP domain-containing protein [Thermoleophilaceae bacterium]
MPTEPANAPMPERFSFRRLLRYSIGLQVIVIAVLLGATLWGALQTKSTSEDFANETRNVLLLSGVNLEFERSRVALRRYVRTGSGFSLGALSQSRNQIATFAGVLESALPPSARENVAELAEHQIAYLEEFGDKAVAQVRMGDKQGASGVLASGEAVAQLGDVSRLNVLVTREIAQRQASAEQAVSSRQQLNALLIVISGLIILGAGIGVILWIRSQTMVPLENLAMASRKLGHGDLSARVEPGGVEEIALTGSAFNQMAEEVEQHVGQLHELSVARSRFVSSVSHELRTPITALRGYLELLSQGEAGALAPDQARFVEIADRNARQLSDLIDDLLTLSRVQSGRMGLRTEVVNVRELLHELKTEMMPIGAERGVDVVLVDTGDLIVQGDSMRLRQAFGNLLSNAIKYSRDGQAVVVRALAVDRQAVISFVDWGMGIPREDLPQIAEPFFRSSSSEGVPGTGLGLAIAKQMIELHGGRLAVESELGSGSTFTVYLPLDQVPSGTADEEPPMAQSATTTGD